MRFVWVFKQPEAREMVSMGGKNGLSFDQYVQAFENLDPQERQKFLEKTKQWDQDFNGYSLQKIRTAGLSPAQIEADPDKSHILLASLYLQRDPKNKNRFTANFQGNHLAEYKAIGWFRVFPDTADEIKVWNQVGEVICERAMRGVHPITGVEGYFDAKALLEDPPRHIYIYMYTGFTAEVIKTITPEEAKWKREKNKAEKREKYRSQLKRNSLAQNIMGGQSEQEIINSRLQGLEEQITNMSAPLESSDNRDLRNKIVSMANRYAGSDYFNRDFQSIAMLKGGRLGCAWVASTILKDAGVLDQKIAGVDGVVAALLEQGWTKSFEPPGPGAVVVWGRLPGRYVLKDDGDAQWMPGHKHIGIVTGPNTVVDNRSQRKPSPGPLSGPLIRPGRDIEMVLIPPRSRVTTEQPDNESQASALYEQNISNQKTNDVQRIAADHQNNINHLQITPEKNGEVRSFVEKALANKERYERVSRSTGIPWEVIAAIHYRESSNNFHTYLHNGQPLGSPTTFVPAGILFGEDQWEEAAIHALGGDVTDNNGRPSLKNFRELRKRVGLSADSKDIGKQLAFAEFYNGLGYRKREKTSPYVYAGTNIDQGGMFVADGRFDPNKKDPRIGVAAMLVALNEAEGTPVIRKDQAAV